MAEILENNSMIASGDYSELSEIRSFVKSKAESFGLTKKKSNYIVLAVDEACSNLIRYNMGFDISKKINLNIVENGKVFKVIIKDSGSSFNLLNSPTPEMKEYFNQYKKGGLGIHIIRSIVDNITYNPANPKNPSNTLVLEMNK